MPLAPSRPSPAPSRPAPAPSRPAPSRPSPAPSRPAPAPPTSPSGLWTTPGGNITPYAPSPGSTGYAPYVPPSAPSAPSGGGGGGGGGGAPSVPITVSPAAPTTGIYYSSVPGWRPADPTATVVYIGSGGITTGMVSTGINQQSANIISAGLNIQNATISQQVSEAVLHPFSATLTTIPAQRLAPINVVDYAGGSGISGFTTYAGGVPVQSYSVPSSVVLATAPTIPGTYNPVTNVYTNLQGYSSSMQTAPTGAKILTAEAVSNYERSQKQIATNIIRDETGKPIIIETAALGGGMKSYKVEDYNKEVARLQSVIPIAKFYDPNSKKIYDTENILLKTKTGEVILSTTPVKVYVDPRNNKPITDLNQYLIDNRIPTNLPKEKLKELSFSEFKTLLKEYKPTYDIKSIPSGYKSLAEQQMEYEAVYGGAAPITASDIALLASGVLAPVKLGAAKIGKVAVSQFGAGFIAGPIVGPILTDFEKALIYQPTSIPGRFLKAAATGKIISKSPFLTGVFAEQIAESVYKDAAGTAKSMLTTDLPETLGFIAGGGIKVEAKIPKAKITEFKPSISDSNLEFEATLKTIQKLEPPSLKISYEVPFTTKAYSIDVLKGEYGKALEDIPPEFRQLKNDLEIVFARAKGADISVGNLRLERLKELPKDIETLNIIKDFIREKGLIVGGTTAIETLRLGGESLNLKRAPRDLEIYDPLKRNSKELANELLNRLKFANKKVFLDSKKSQIGFEGIEGHGVNFQEIGGLNLERYRQKIWTNPEGIKIADPVSTAYNKVADLLKREKLESKKGKKLLQKLEKSEILKRSFGEDIYLRFVKDLPAAVQTAEFINRQTIKQFQDLTKTQTPIYQEIKLLQLGRSAERLKPYKKLLKVEEQKVTPYYYTGPQPALFSGAKYVKSYTLELQRQFLMDKKAQLRFIDEIKAKEYVSSEYEYVGTDILKKEISYPKALKAKPETYPSIYPKNIADYSIPYPTIPKLPEVYPAVYPKAKPETYPSIYPETYPSVYPTIPVIVPRITNILAYSESKKKPQEKIKSLGPGYNVEVKAVKTNTFIKVNEYPLTHERAKDIGAYYVRQTLARTYRIKKFGKAQPDYQFMYIPEGYFTQSASKLREYKIRKRVAIETPEQFIQKSRFILESPAEKRQIKEFQRLARQALS